MQTNLSQSIDITENKAKYDESVKELFADKQVLAWILKYTLEEFGDDEIPEIMNHLSQPVISSIRMEPGQTNRDKIEKQSEEDVVIGEGKIYYDIRFSAYHGKEQIKILVNIEAQKSTSPSKLGYHLDNRIIYYLGRMISAQKEVEFTKSEYDQLKAVRSIWICMDTADEEDSINRIRFVQEIVYGKEMNLANIDKVQGIIIRLRSNENVEKSKNILIAMLEELLRKEDAEKKKRMLSDDYGLVMDEEMERRVNSMCNLSEVLIEKGIEKGRAAGELTKLISMICKKKAKGIAAKDTADMLEEEEEVVYRIYEIAENYAPDYDIEAICEEFRKVYC